MAILCLSKNIDDLKERVARVTVGYTYDDRPVTVRDLKIQGAVAAVLKDAPQALIWCRLLNIRLYLFTADLLQTSLTVAIR